jgi:hypothetical protein
MMSALLLVAYGAALGLWLPLAIIAAVKPSFRRRVMVPLVASALGAAYEAYMSFVGRRSLPCRAGAGDRGGRFRRKAVRSRSRASPTMNCR